MMTLVRICGEHRHAVGRDLLALGPGYHWDDIGVKLTVWELVSIVIASPPGTAVYHAETRSGTMTPDQQMLASMAGYQPLQDVPGANKPASTERPAADPLADMRPMAIGGSTVQLDAMDPVELVRKREEIAARVRESKSQDKVSKEKYDPFAAGKKARAERLAALGHSPTSGPALPDHIAGGA
jgi:hypothetical protein